jgi:hypothetical protein
MNNMDSQQFLTTEEAGEVDRALLSTHEKFLTRITISSLRLLQKIAIDQNIPVAELTPEIVIAWFEADSKRRLEHGDEAAALQW